MALGNNALAGVSTAINTVGIGTSALAADNAGWSVAVGYQALSQYTGVESVAVGGNALWQATTGVDNVALGPSALYSMTTGSWNIGIGADALHQNSTGTANVAVGENSCYNFLTTPITMVGMSTGQYVTGTHNVGVGWTTLQGASGGASAFQNTAIGDAAMTVITSGANNTACGYNALTAITSGSHNTAVGWKANLALTTVGNTTALGDSTVASAAGAVAIGIDNASTSASATVANQFALGTALHQVQILNNTTGAGSAALGANSPATTNTAPYTWFKMMSGDGSTVYVPAWK